MTSKRGPKPKPTHERMLAGVTYEPNTGCWLWTGAVNEKGYGIIGTGPKDVGRTHRISYSHFIGPIPAGASVLHSCDTPACCNPAHLRLGTEADNSDDMVRRGRARCGGHSCMKPGDVQSIRRGEATASDYAERYGVTRKHVLKIQRGAAWQRLSA